MPINAPIWLFFPPVLQRILYRTPEYNVAVYFAFLQGRCAPVLS
jgi:hypothetical protein